MDSNLALKTFYLFSGLELWAAEKVMFQKMIDLSPEITTTMKPPNSDCKDKKSKKYCKKKKRQCKKASIYKKCLKTCNKCDDEPPKPENCKDKKSKKFCSKQKKTKKCSSKKNKKNCKKTCGHCQFF